jgi:hypothetical protein
MEETKEIIETIETIETKKAKKTKKTIETKRIIETKKTKETTRVKETKGTRKTIATIEDYRKLTQNWQDLFVDKNNQYLIIFGLLNAGFVFPMTQEQYQKIIGNTSVTPENINYYFGIEKVNENGTEEERLVILMIDEESDKAGNAEMVFKVEFTETLQEKYREGIELIFEHSQRIIEDHNKEENYNSKNRISVLTALIRFLKWNLFGQNWARYNFTKFISPEINEEDFLFPLVQLPFQGIIDLFDKNNHSDPIIYHFFGLHNDENAKDDNVLGNYTFDLMATSNSDEGFPKYFMNVSCICNTGGGGKEDIDNFSLLPRKEGR